METMKIDTKPVRFFITSALVFVLYNLLALINFFLNYSIIEPIRQNFEISLFKGSLFFVNTIAFQNYSICFMLIIYSMHTRLTLINKFATKIAENAKGNNEEVLKNLKSSAYFVDTLCDCMESIKFCYTINTVAYFTQFAFFTILSIYSLISCMLQGNISQLDISYCLLTFIWELFYAPFVIWTFVFGSLIKKEGRNFIVIVEKLRFHCHDLRVSKRIDLILMQCHHRRPLFECGFYVVDWKLLLQAMASCFSYLVVIIQFELQNIWTDKLLNKLMNN